MLSESADVSPKFWFVDVKVSKKFLLSQGGPKLSPQEIFDNIKKYIYVHDARVAFKLLW